MPPTATDSPTLPGATSATPSTDSAAPDADTTGAAAAAEPTAAFIGPSRVSPFALDSERRARAVQSTVGQALSFELVQDRPIPCRGHTDGVAPVRENPIQDINKAAFRRFQHRMDSRPKETPGAHLACVPHAALHDPVYARAKDTVGKIVEFCSLHPTHPFRMIQVVGVRKVRRAQRQTFQKFFDYLKFDIHPDFEKSESFFLVYISETGVLEGAHMAHCRLLHPDRARFYYGATDSQVEALLPGAKEVVPYLIRHAALAKREDEARAPPATAAATTNQPKRGRSAERDAADARRAAQPKPHSPRGRAPSRGRAAVVATAPTATVATAPATAAPADTAPAVVAPADFDSVATAPVATAPATATAPADTAPAVAARTVVAGAATAATELAGPPRHPAADGPPANQTARDTAVSANERARERAPLLSAPSDDWSLTGTSSNTLLTGPSLPSDSGEPSD